MKKKLSEWGLKVYHFITLIAFMVFFAYYYFQETQTNQLPTSQPPPTRSSGTQTQNGPTVARTPGKLPPLSTSQPVTPPPIPPPVVSQPNETPPSTPQTTLPEPDTEYGEASFKGCPGEGDGNDPLLNRLKNRVDQGNYVLTSFDTILKLTWPPKAEQRDRAKLSTEDTAAIAQHEGAPITVEGYIAGAKLQGPESANCHGEDAFMRDFHIWLVKDAKDDRDRSIVVEITPRIRAKHIDWQVEQFEAFAKSKRRVRISGWLMFDQEHPEQIGKTRATLWEIHPIMRVEIERQGQWIALE